MKTHFLSLVIRVHGCPIASYDGKFTPDQMYPSSSPVKPTKAGAPPARDAMPPNAKEISPAITSDAEGQATLFVSTFLPSNWSAPNAYIYSMPVYLRATGWTAEVRFPARIRYFSLLHRVQTGSGAHPTSYPVGTEGSSTV
jgi:hypothetical protein